MVVLGLWDGHDAGAALMIDNQLVAAVNEERFTRRKLEVHFPTQSIAECLRLGGVAAGDVTTVAASTSDPAKMIGRWFPSTKERYYQVRRRRTAPGRLACATNAAKYRITEWGPNAVSAKLNQMATRRALTGVGLGRPPLRLFDHHWCHACTAAYGSGFDSCAVVTIDGVGDGLSSTIMRFDGDRLELIRSTPSTHSLGVFFEHVTRLLNMRELEDEGKVMALANFAAPVPDHDNPLLPLVEVIDGRITCRPPSGRMASTLARSLWRYPNEQFAFLAQRVVEKTTVALVNDAARLTGQRKVALAGGVASNIKATRLARHLPAIDDIAVFPHMGDGGLALGAALASVAESQRPNLDLSSLALGPAFTDDDIVAAMREAGITASRPANLPQRVADLIEQGEVVLWFQGRMEFGPRALGHRSVLARPDRPRLKDRLNLVLKQRVWYQPFCPSMLESEARRVFSDWTESGRGNRHMTMAYMVEEHYRDALSGVTNVDGSCRPQFVDDDDPGPFAELLRQLRPRLPVAAVLNTSFNIHGEPLVCRPSEAFDVFHRSGADALAIGSFLIERGRDGH
ncbi:MAG: carbamoyltransferase C-terminal domain-containing protein [Vicinamibacterales bacterium]